MFARTLQRDEPGVGRLGDMVREASPILERRVLRVSLQANRRGLFMPIWNIEEIVNRRLVGRLFRKWRKERGG